MVCQKLYVLNHVVHIGGHCLLRLLELLFSVLETLIFVDKLSELSCYFIGFLFALYCLLRIGLDNFLKLSILFSEMFVFLYQFEILVLDCLHELFDLSDEQVRLTVLAKLL